MSFIKMTIGITITVVLVGIFGTIYLYYNQEKFDFHFIDASKFKEEYESLNGKIVPNADRNYITIEVNENNPIVYSSYEEIIDIINNGTGIIYLGYKGCAPCRNIVPVLIDTAMENSINKIYYLDIHKDRDVIDNNGDTFYIKNKGTDNYYKLLDSLGDKVSLYKNTFPRIYFPSVIFVKNGEVVDIHSGTVKSQTNSYYSLTVKQKEELRKIYQGYIDKIKQNN